MAVKRHMTRKQSRYKLAKSAPYHTEPEPYRALAAAIIVQAVRDLHKPDAYGATGERGALRRAGIHADAERFFSSPWCAVIADGLGLSLDKLRAQAVLPETYGRLRGAALAVGQMRNGRSV